MTVHCCVKGMRWVVLLAMLCGLWPVTHLAAQAPAGAGPANPDLAGSPTLVRDPVVAEILSTEPTTPANIARVINMLIELGHPAETRSLVTRLLEMNLDEDQSVALYDQLGSTFLTRLATSSAIAPQGPELANHLRKAVESRYTDPQRLAQLIDHLQSPDSQARRTALARLQLGRSVAVAALLEALQNNPDPQRAAVIVDTLIKLRGDSLLPVIAALDSGDAALRAHLLTVLGGLNDSRAQLALLAPAFAADSTESERERAQAALWRQGLPLDALQAGARLYAAAEKLYMPANPANNELELTTELWSWDATANEPKAALVASDVAAAAWALRWATDARRILPENAPVRRLWLSALVQNALARTIAGQAVEQAWAGVYESFESVGLEAVEDALIHFASREGSSVMDGSALATLSAPARVSAPAAVAAEVLGVHGNVGLLHNRGPRPSALVEATRHADRRLRFAAVGAVMRLAPEEVYPGSSFVAAALRELIASSESRQVLAGATDMAVAVDLAGLLAEVGYRPLSAQGADDLVRQAINAQGLELILLDYRLAMLESGELLTRLRRDNRTANVPILIVAASEDLPAAENLALRHRQCSAQLRPFDSAAAERLAQRGRAMAGMAYLSAEERLAQAQQALEWLKPLAAQRYPIYPVAEFEPALIAALGKPALAATAAEVLGSLGSHAAQRALVDLASRPSAPLPVRRAAAEAFATAVNRRGIMLRSDEILQQYDRYNASERQSAESQQVLGSLLDVMESRRMTNSSAALNGGASAAESVLDTNGPTDAENAASSTP